MSDDAKCYAATPAATLEQHITDSNVPKNEAEWWAYHEIIRLREENARLLGLLREAHVKMDANNLWSNLRNRVAAAIREGGKDE